MLRRASGFRKKNLPVGRFCDENPRLTSRITFYTTSWVLSLSADYYQTYPTNPLN